MKVNTYHPQFSIEDGFTLCRLLHLDGPDIQWAHNLPESSWGTIVNLARAQGLSALLYDRLKGLQPELGISDNLFAELRHRFRRETAVSLLRSYQLTQLLDAFQQAGIPVVALKGAHLAELVYKVPELRSMVDFDFLVHFSDLEKAVATLSQLGYSASRKFWIDVECKINHQLPPLSKKGRMFVELHWTLLVPTLPFSIDIEGVWQRTVQASLSGGVCQVLSAEDLLLHLCLHAATQHHLAGGIRLLYDIALAVQHYQAELELDWNVLWERAQSWRAERVLYLMLDLASDLLGAPIPETFWNRLPKDTIEPEARQAALNLIFDHTSVTYPLTVDMAEIAEASGFWARLGVILRRVFLSPQQLANMYPVRPDSPLVLLYYPIRWKDMVIKYADTFWGFLRGKQEVLDDAWYMRWRAAQEQRLMEALVKV